MKVSNNNLVSRQAISSVERTAEIQPAKNTEADTEKSEPVTLNKTEINKKIESVNKFLESSQTSLKFQFHDKLNEYYVSILDSKTQEVIKEIPPRKFLDMYATMMESIGLIVDHKI